MIESLIMYLAFGCLAGLLAGLLGVGGGMVLVPILLYTLPLLGIVDYANQLALGTSLACIMFTSLSSVRAHHKHRTVNWNVVGSFTPGIVAGTLIGGTIATSLPARPLTLIFVIFLIYVSIQTFLDFKPRSSWRLPGRPGLLIAGSGIGFASSFVGIGGGSLTVPFLTFCNVNMREAIGTSAGTGFPIALSGAAIYAYHGWQAPGLPEHAFGFIYLPALLGLSLASVLTAPLGARIAYKVPVLWLKRFFAVFLMAVAVNMIIKFL